MSASSDGEVVVTDGPSSRYSRLYHWVLDHLAKFPGRVTVVTFVAGVVVTVVVVLLGGDGSPTSVVGLVATLWALFFGVMIYLLTARDTDTVLEQIADLHEQLSTALASPDDAGEGGDGTQPSEEAPPTTPAPTTPAPRLPAPTTPAPATPGRTRQPGGPRGETRVLTGAADIAAGVPPELLAAWTSATGGATADLARVWTRDPRSERQWVFEATDGERWVVFSRGAQGAGVISLSHPPTGQRRRPARVQRGNR
ncbi:hypothetical protein [Leifsonia aquatica]|uniref:Uncharacterized protein n=2 Tax=Leifsonia aquatica TaxID=144185 RepID=A0A7W4UWX9_LEIAQ|nr:hypothetical protein [Leifsonia aquatica]MBB2967829.1 hypothetical protein [Leifsonia aquatica]